MNISYYGNDGGNVAVYQGSLFVITYVRNMQEKKSLIKHKYILPSFFSNIK